MLLGAIILLATLLCACGESGVPEGMHLVRGGEELGYYFYAPEHWTVANQGDIAAAYTSKIDNSSVTFVKAEAPEGDVKSYFHSQMATLPFPYEMAEGSDGVKCSFGNAKEAYKFAYTYTYKELSFGAMQILVKEGEDFYIFTYTSNLTERADGVSYYKHYLADVENIIKNFKFTERKGAEAPDTPDYPRDEDGYYLISDRTLAGFDMYVPEGWEVIDSSAIVSAKTADGSSVNISKATYTNVTRDEYWRMRKENLELLADKTELDGKEVSTLREIEVAKELTLEGVDWAFSYEYTYSLLGKGYHVYQVLIVDGYDGYVFTYTAKEADYATHLKEAEAILKKVKF